MRKANFRCFYCGSPMPLPLEDTPAQVVALGERTNHWTMTERTERMPTLLLRDGKVIGRVSGADGVNDNDLARTIVKALNFAGDHHE